MKNPSSQARIDELQRRVSDDPSSRAFLELTRLYHREGRLEEAARLCAEGVRRNPEYLSARVLLGRIYFDMNLMEEARDTMEYVVVRAPDNLMARRVLAEICLHQGQLDAALERYRALLAFKPDDQESAERIEEIEAKLQGRPADAETPEGATVGEPDRALATPTLAEIYLQQGHAKKAWRLYQKVLRGDPDNLEARERLAAIERDYPVLDPDEQVRRRKIDLLSSWLRTIRGH
jgi:tetratricopeptide (TPR) repeat protein